MFINITIEMFIRVTYLLIFMKTINETFSDDEHKRLKNLKGNLSWRNFILLMYNHCVDSKTKGKFEVISYE